MSGQSIVADLTRMPHLLIAGATGQGKSVCINALITSLLFQVTPDHMRLLLIDPKRVELTGYNGLPHLALPVLVESHQAAAALRWAVAEMDRRYKLFSAEGVRNIAAYNDKAAAKLARSLPYVVIVIDELADLMMVAAGEIEELICRIAQLARAVGIHLIIATQRPSTDIITGLIKANIPSASLSRWAPGRQPASLFSTRPAQEAARPRRHAVPAGRRRQADPHSGRLRQRPGGRWRGRLLEIAGAGRATVWEILEGAVSEWEGESERSGSSTHSLRSARSGRGRGRRVCLARTAQVQRGIFARRADRGPARGHIAL